MQGLVALSLFYIAALFVMDFNANHVEGVGIGYGLVGLNLLALGIRVWRGHQSGAIVTSLAISVILLSVYLLLSEFIQIAVSPIFGPTLQIGGLAFLLALSCLIILAPSSVLRRWPVKVNLRGLAMGLVPLMSVLPLVWFTQAAFDEERARWFEDRQQDWQPAAYRAMTFGGCTSSFIGSSYTQSLAGPGDSIQSFPAAVEIVKAIREAGGVVIRIGASDDAWQLNDTEDIRLSDALVEAVRGLGGKLMLADNQHPEHLRYYPVSWEEFKGIHLRRIAFLTQRYRPDYYNVVTEVSSYHKAGVKGHFDVGEWVRQTEQAVDLVKQINPQTKTSVSIVPEERNDERFFQEVLKLKNLDIVGFDIYFRDQFQAAERLLATAHPHRFGKQLWITETWNGLAFPWARPSKAKEDAKWIRTAFLFAQKNNLDGFLPWPFGYFNVYYEPWSQREVDYSGRTLAFQAYKEVIEKVR